MGTKTSIHIAYAEEQWIVRKGIISVLSVYDDFVFSIEAGDGYELLEKLSSTEKFPDICIVGIKMYPMDGHTTLVELKKRWPGLKVLVLTDNNNVNIMMRMIAAGANGYLLKKSTAEIIVTALNDIYQNGYYHSTEATGKIFRQIKENKIKAPKFSSAELEVIKYAGTNLSYEAIGRKIGVSRESVEGYRVKIFRKLGIANRAELALFAFQSGLAIKSDNHKDIP